MKMKKAKTPNKADVYKPWGAMEALFKCHAAEVLLEGPAGTGKTRAALEHTLRLADQYPGMRALWVRKTRRSMTESVLTTFEQKVLPPTWLQGIGGPQRATRHVYRLPNGSTFVIAGMDRASRIMSSEFDLIVAFEACELTESDWELLLTRLRNNRMPFQQAIADTNPDAPTHWLNRRASQGRMTRLITRHEDNPTVTPQYLARLDRLTGVRHARLWRGIWAAADGAVYDVWDPQRHIVEPFPIPATWRRIRAIDFGYTNPFVCQWWAIDPDGRMYMYREIYRTRRLVRDHAEYIARLSQGERIDATVTDHDAEARATLEHDGIDTTPASKAIIPGIQAVAQRLRIAGDGKPRLMILRDALVEPDRELVDAHLPCCTAEEFDSYVWSKRGDERPLGQSDHGMDAMRYAVRFVDTPPQPELTVQVVDPLARRTRRELVWMS
jgi:phage terminase large subunit